MPYTPDNPYIPGDPYSYDLKWIVTQIQTCLDNYESLTTNFGTLQTNFDTLYDYVHDYFDNLDISQEVEDKIEEMYNNGFFDNIINDWITDHNVLLVDTDQSGTFTDAEKAQARKNIAAGSSNENLADNGWFTVNQRGFTTGTSGYVSDRWRIGGGSPTVTALSPYGITVSTNSAYNIVQVLPYTVSEYNGKTMTLSAIIDGDLITTTFVYGSGVISSTTFGNDLIQYDCSNAEIRITHSVSTATHDFTVTAVKLERGAYSTLPNDTPPNYTTELAKCQRYFVRIKNTSGSRSVYGLGLATNATQAWWLNVFANKGHFRVTPSITTSGSFYLYIGSTAYAITAVAVNGINGDADASLAFTSSGLTANTACQIAFDPGAYIDFSADL